MFRVRSPAAPPAPESDKPSPAAVVTLGALLVAAIFLAYQPAWRAGFIWDDDKYVTHNPLLTAPDGLARIWFSTDSPSQYFPLVYTNFRVQHALWALDPRGYHLVNIALHAINALLVWRLFSRLRIPGAWLGAAVFALHPIQAESVAWITELKNVQSLFFCLLTLLLWERFTDPEPPVRSAEKTAPRWSIYALSLVCFALALFSKTTACTLPAGLVLVLWIRNRPVSLARWLQIAPLVLMGLVMGLVSIWWERNRQGTAGDEFSYGAADRMLIAARALSFYLGKVLWPDDLTFIYPLWKIDARSPAAWAWFLPPLGVAAVVLALRKRFGRGPEAALVFFAATLFPLLGFFMLYTFRYTFVADHYVYVALLGPAALAGAASARLGSRLRAMHHALPAALGGVLVLGLGALSWKQSHQYKDLRTLWETTVARSPETFMAHNNLGALELAEGNPERAAACFERALAIKPDHTSALANLGNARLVQGRHAEALALFRRVVDFAPADAKGWSDLGQALEQLGDVAQTTALYRRALELDPRLAETRFLLGRRELAEGRITEAEREIERALALYPNHAEARYHLGLVHLAQERQVAAETEFSRTLELAPTHAFALHNLGILRAVSGDLLQAEALLRRAVASAPAAPAIRHTLARVLLTQGRPDRAEAELVAVLAQAPDFAPARIDLAQTQNDLGRFADAAATLQAHLARHPDDVEARHSLGRMLLAAGRTREAATVFQRVLAEAPDHPGARADLAALNHPTSAL